MTIMIFNKTSTQFIRHQNAAIFDNTSAIPYDITMYDLTVQQNIDCEYLFYRYTTISWQGKRDGARQIFAQISLC